MNYRAYIVGMLVSALLPLAGAAAPVIDPIANITIPAGKSLILPVTATSSGGRPLTYTVTSSANGVAVVMHTNNPFWQLTVAQAAATGAPGAYQTPFRGGLATVTNVGTMTFMLFPEYAPHTVNVFQGLTESGFYNSNTIFHRVVSNFVIQGGDPATNGSGGLVFQYADEFNPQAIFSGNGQLALANSGVDTDGSQFYVTIGTQRFLDFKYTLFGQLVRGFNVMSNIDSTAVDANSRPLANEIIQLAGYVTNTADTVITLTATNVPGVAATITVIADDGAGGRATNTFTATAVTDGSSNDQPFLYPNNAVTNTVAPVNGTLTNFLTGLEMDGEPLGWYQQANTSVAYSLTGNESNNILRTLTYNVTNASGQLQFFMEAPNNYVGPVSFYLEVYNSANDDDYELFNFAFGDTPISGQTNTVTALAGVAFTNLVLATFTNGVPGSVYTNFTADVNWGDDTTNAATVTANAAGQKAVLGSHTYPYPGNYPVYVQVQSGLGASATILSFVNVTNPLAPVTNLLTVQVSGQGTVPPGNVAAPRAVGESYSINATRANLWFLQNWTDSNGFVLATTTNLTYTMSPGLALNANFALIANPTVAVVAPTNSQVVTNLYSLPATIFGTASNNAVVTNVWYQVNSGGWQKASGTTNWTASFAPVYGTSNLIQTYAVNNFGYLSATNSMLVKYLVGGIVTVNTNGLGSIVPNVNNALLPFGTNYTLTATPASGFVFSNWTGTFGTNNAALSFTMTNSPSLTANFAETNKPTLTIISPTAGQHLTNALPTVTGTASDTSWGVASVWYRLNSGAWNEAATANAWTNWSATIEVPAGSDTVAAYALNLGGNYSATNSVTFVSSNSFLLQLSFLTTKPLTTTGLNFGLLVSTGLTGHIQFSTNLISWATLTNFIGTSSPIHLLDPAATNSSKRFYRAVIP